MAVEDCNIYRQSARGGYVPFTDPANPPEKFLRAIDIETGKIAWEVPQVGAPEGTTPACFPPRADWYFTARPAADLRR